MAIRKRKGRASPYQVYWNNPFTGKRESLSFVTLSEARKEESLVKHRLEHDRESFRPAAEDNAQTGGTIREIISLYLATKTTKAENLQVTLYHLQDVIRVFGGRDVASLDRKDLIKYIAANDAMGIKITTSHRRLTIMRAALSWAADMGLIAANPIHGIKLPKGKNEKLAPPTPEEIAKILYYAHPHIKRVVSLATMLGVRVGPTELFRLRWADVDFGRSIIRVWSAAKNPEKPYRDIPIRANLLTDMKIWAAEDAQGNHEFIIHYDGKPVQKIKTAWAATLKRAGITRRIRPYDLRHAFATNALDAGADLGAVADIMGHSTVATVLKHYQHTKAINRKQAVDLLPEIPTYVPTDKIKEQDRFSPDCTAGTASEDFALP